MSVAAVPCREGPWAVPGGPRVIPSLVLLGRHRFQPVTASPRSPARRLDPEGPGPRAAQCLHRGKSNLGRRMSPRSRRKGLKGRGGGSRSVSRGVDRLRGRHQVSTLEAVENEGVETEVDGVCAGVRAPRAATSMPRYWGLVPESELR